ncbi:efflux RND transporter periplasmic adaptor subunit [Burkholderia multivorans]|jgi:multidrug efflux system membrane fusion protein|uniref:efflux RND transporter periplasmic adaptor subunit n=1 Tax=Burkholderia multivorans TaxID=87883 RepID=UPI00057EB22D|nr:efflux RND transporter periplasmic adaptor subunit [Burkholderia multivorans]KHS16355.1 hemolysin secretion protein D [Burkholderia multivorans]KHS20490.1 hemolysin secretion protein D [Burkholderia multivorans]MBR7921736.1 efflux RND transporter periplasmic adaptor subunit [Burkholderia multivorans]MBR8102543.1 efflux RND transporter periplasmic adaptor subunit [Burkholderia multivorans]MBR8338826.1 efflux RND transporter periplasmic adaptor subunit [Burkholderia multivorans]
MLSLSFRRTSPLGAACVLLLALSGCHDGQGGAPSAPLPEVGVATVVPRTVRIADEFNGRVEAVDAVELRPRVSGYLQRIRYKEGDLVAQGAVLFEIDPRPYRIALDRAIAQQQRARAAEHLARVQLQRVQTLIDAHATSQEELDNARAAAEQARADLQAADAAVADAKLNLGFTEVRAPIAGRVGRALATAGNLARADDTLLTTVVSQDPVYVYFDCDEQSYLRYNAQRADPAHRAIGADPVRVGLANETGFPHAGTVDFLDNRLDPQTGTIRARVRLPNADHTFTPGLYARVQLVSGRERSAVLVDDKAVLTDQDRKYVYVIGPGDKALRRDVTIGRDLDGQRIVEKGLNAGDRVVVDGVQRIYYPGAQVKPKPQPARADAQPGGAAQAVADAGAPAAQ